MIRTFRNRALKRFWIDGDSRGIRPDQVQRLLVVLKALDVAAKPSDSNLPGLRFHRLHTKPIRFSLTVTANWRVTFEWDGFDAVNVDYEDYH